MIPVEGHKNLFRDENTGAILNVDSNAYSSYVAARNKKSDERAELDRMKEDIDEIKQLLKNLTNQIT